LGKGFVVFERNIYKKQYN